MNLLSEEISGRPTSSLPLEKSNFLLSEDRVKLYLSFIHQMHLMAKFEYASLTLLTEMPLQNLVDNEENCDYSIIYWPDTTYTLCKSEGGGSVLILRSPVSVKNTAAAGLFT